MEGEERGTDQRVSDKGRTGAVGGFRGVWDSFVNGNADNLCLSLCGYSRFILTNSIGPEIERGLERDNAIQTTFSLAIPPGKAMPNALNPVMQGKEKYDD